MANEAKQAEENKGWCEGRQNEKQDAITSSKRDVADLQATIEDSTATIGSLTSTIDELTNSISKSEAEFYTLSKSTYLFLCQGCTIPYN